MCTRANQGSPLRGVCETAGEHKVRPYVNAD